MAQLRYINKKLSMKATYLKGVDKDNGGTPLEVKDFKVISMVLSITLC